MFTFTEIWPSLEPFSGIVANLTASIRYSFLILTTLFEVHWLYKQENCHAQLILKNLLLAPVLDLKFRQPWIISFINPDLG
jgi:hypothetical protein